MHLKLLILKGKLVGIHGGGVHHFKAFSFFGDLEAMAAMGFPIQKADSQHILVDHNLKGLEN